MRTPNAVAVLVSRLSSLVSLISLISLVSPVSAQSADLILRHATVYTVDAAHPTAQAVAVRDGKIIYVGTDAGVTKYVGTATRTLELAGRFVFPGFADAHAHFPGIGAREIAMLLNLEGTRSKDEFLVRVAAFEEDRHGSIVVGKAADFTVLDQDIMKIPEAQIPKTKNVMTIVSGEIVYQQH